MPIHTFESIFAEHFGVVLNDRAILFIHGLKTVTFVIVHFKFSLSYMFKLQSVLCGFGVDECAYLRSPYANANNVSP